ncbi:regenerating islet-derived protein 4 [Tyto alba]|uniref:regenerating islet-derived protein 4 n=1 Tax=Tyto alba TaxID=56313 RepID=UPI001C669E60|nr:regenerating islet-derived protein 4 [Tyto alba]XP_042641131.1 regenerating islet-derived protein 4 [Tyto alba]
MVTAARLALLLLGCVGLLQPAGARYISYCPKGWSYYKLSCFRYFHQLRSWDEAESQCQANHAGAHLAWVEEPREAATLRRVISYYQRVQPVWLGLRYGRESRAWQWVSGDKYSVTSGLAGDSTHRGTCGMLTHFSGFNLWSSADCSQKHHYICKFTPLL